MVFIQAAVPPWRWSRRSRNIDIQSLLLRLLPWLWLFRAAHLPPGEARRGVGVVVEKVQERDDRPFESWRSGRWCVVVVVALSACARPRLLPSRHGCGVSVMAAAAGGRWHMPNPSRPWVEHSFCCRGGMMCCGGCCTRCRGGCCVGCRGRCRVARRFE